MLSSTCCATGAPRGLPRVQFVGPLNGIRILELAGIGPGPFAAMLLGDLGADVIQIGRPDRAAEFLPRLMARNRRSILVNLKSDRGVAILLDLVETADVLIEGFRPGVTERLGIGPGECLIRNPRLVYARMTGWGQDGPLATTAGHDIDYIALSGALHAIGRRGERPVPPLNLVGDFGGGSLYLVVGVLSALVERAASGRGQVVDAAMVDGAASLMTMFYEMVEAGLWSDERGGNLLDGGAPFYDTYETADGGYVAVGALEPQFFSELLRGLDIDRSEFEQYDRSSWDAMRHRFAAVFLCRSRADWEAVFSGSDACVTPVLTMAEAPGHTHNVARRTFVDVAGRLVPAPAPRFGRTPSAAPRAAAAPGADTDAILADLGLAPSEISILRESGVLG